MNETLGSVAATRSVSELKSEVLVFFQVNKQMLQSDADSPSLPHMVHTIKGIKEYGRGFDHYNKGKQKQSPTIQCIQCSMYVLILFTEAGWMFLSWAFTLQSIAKISTLKSQPINQSASSVVRKARSDDCGQPLKTTKEGCEETERAVASQAAAAAENPVWMLLFLVRRRAKNGSKGFSRLLTGSGHSLAKLCPASHDPPPHQ